MDILELRSACLLGVVLAPLCGFLVLALWGLFTSYHHERYVAAIAKTAALAATTSLAGLVAIMISRGEYHYVERYHSWLSFGSHHFEITFSVNTLSVGFLTLTTLLSGLVGKFSKTYIHLDEGFTRFYLLLMLATFGMTLVVVADSLGLTVMGWEFLGISSTLLIAFFHSRRGPVVNGLRTFTVYRIADVGLLLAMMYAHNVFGTTELGRFIHTENGPYGSFDGTEWHALVIGLLFFLSASGKSSTLPFFPWLPGAMEGPTPSSAIFYGAFAVHAGPYLFLRYAPIVSASPTLSSILIGMGLLSACLASLAGRIRADVKTSLAYATIMQVSIIYAEIGMHWYYLAAFHTAGHMCLRTYQFLRAPSALHDLHVRSVLGVAARERGAWYGKIVPIQAQRWLYRLALEQGAILSVYQSAFVRPFIDIATALSRFEVVCDRLLDRVLVRKIEFLTRHSDGESKSTVSMRGDSSASKTS